MAKLSQIKLGNTTYDIGAAWGNISNKPDFDATYVNVSGDTMTGALNFANGTWNKVGDDCALGDYNQAGVIGIKGLNGATGIYFVPYSGSVAQKIFIDGAGTMSVTGKISADTLQTVQNGVTSTIGSQNSGWLHYSTNSSSGHWFNANVAVQGNIYAGSSYNKLVLTEENYTNYAATKNHNHDSTYLKLSGGTLTGLLNAHGGISLNSSTAQASGAPEYLLGIKAFAEGGNIIWQSKSNVSVGYADSAGTCTSLSTNAGSATKAIYFTGGKPAQCSDTINHNISGYSASLAYPAQITTDANIDGFLEANRFKVGTWNSTSSPGVSNGIILSGGWTNTNYGFQIAIDDDPTYFLALRQRDGSGWRAWKRIPMADGTGASGTWGISVNGSSTSCTGNAHSTSVDGTCIAYAGWSNEFNFGGSNAASTIYIGYRAIDSKPIPTGFIFGGADGSATLTAKSLSNAGRSVSWINGRDSALVKFTSYSGYNAITSMKTTNGSWEMGVYSNDTMYFNYASDTNYSAGTNSTTQVSINSSGYLNAPRVYGAVWNDYAEFRNQDEKIEPGYCVASNNNGKVYKTNQHLQACDGIVSDTYGFSIGETDNCKTPLAVSGRVLAYYEGNKYDYNAGDTVGASANGKVIKMTREEITKYPDRIVGIVSEIPEYETWGTGNVEVDGRIWIKVK